MSETTQTRTSEFHRQYLTQLMIMSMAAPALEDAYAELLNAAYAMLSDLCAAEQRIKNLQGD